MTDVYRVAAPLYDLLSGEWPIYRAGRVAGIAALGLRPGETVLDVGCGSGLSIPLLAPPLGRTGQIIGLDSSAQMLAVAEGRARRSPTPVTLIETDATRPEIDMIRGHTPQAVLFCYSLSIMRPWRTAWDAVTSAISPGTTVVIVDLAVPTQHRRTLGSLARLACRLGGSDIEAHPWQALSQTCDNVHTTTLRDGHIQVWSGTWQ